MSADTEMIEDFRNGYSEYLSFDVCDSFLELFLFKNKDLTNDYFYWGFDTTTREKAIDRLVQFLVPSIDHWPTYDDHWSSEDLSKLCERMQRRYAMWEDRLRVQSQR